MPTKIFPADKVFSDYIRERDGWECQRCFKQFVPPTSGLHCSHFHSRGKWATRYDPQNCIALCYGCHRYMDKHNTEYETYKVDQLGQGVFDALTLRAWSRSTMGSKFWKTLSAEQALKIFEPLFI